jgi:hypothetical protein
LQAQIDAGKLLVSADARWSLRALTGGYAYAPNTKEPKANGYRVLMEAIEAAAPVFLSNSTETEGNYAYDQRSGVRHLTSRPGRKSYD